MSNTSTAEAISLTAMESELLAIVSNMSDQLNEAAACIKAYDGPPEAVTHYQTHAHFLGYLEQFGINSRFDIDCMLGKYSK